MVKLIGLVGTNSKKSTNRQLLQYIQKHFSEQAEIELVEIKDIPMFNKPTPKVVPQEAQAIADKIAANNIPAIQGLNNLWIKNINTFSASPPI